MTFWTPLCPAAPRLVTILKCPSSMSLSSWMTSRFSGAKPDSCSILFALAPDSFMNPLVLCSAMFGFSACFSSQSIIKNPTLW